MEIEIGFRVLIFLCIIRRYNGAELRVRLGVVSRDARHGDAVKREPLLQPHHAAGRRGGRGVVDLVVPLVTRGTHGGGGVSWYYRRWLSR